MNRVPVFIAFDVEDPIHAESDDAVKRLGETLTHAGLPGCFFMVGEKARLLRARGRRDVLEALSQHEIDYHGNYWFEFPEVAMVYCERLPWDEAVAKALEMELAGLTDVAEITGQFPTAWVQHQGNAGPALAEALRRAGVRVWNGGFGGGGEPLWAMDILTVSRKDHGLSTQGQSLAPNRDPLRPSTKPPVNPEEELREFERMFDAELEKGISHLVLLGHPTCWVTAEWWGWYEWSGMTHLRGVAGPGPYPSQRQFRRAMMRSAEDVDAHFEWTRRAWEWLASRNDIEVMTFADFAKRHESSHGQWMSFGDLTIVARQIAERLDAVAVGGVDLSAADALYLFAQAFAYAFDGGAMPEQLQIKRVLGPVEEPWHVSEEVTLKRDGILAGSRDLVAYVNRTGRLPAIVKAHYTELGPGEFAVGLAKALLAVGSTGAIPEQVVAQPTPGVPAAAEEPFFSNYSVGSTNAPPGFRVERMREQVRWQSWSYRPVKRNT